MKQGRNYGFVLLMIIAIFVSLTACGKNSKKTDGTQNPSSDVGTSDEGNGKQRDTIVWLVQDWGIDLQALESRLNNVAQTAGFEHRVELQSISLEEDYISAVHGLIQKGEVDIVWLGAYDNQQELIHFGDLMDLTSYIYMDDYAQLRDAFYAGLWETVKADDRIVAIPTQLAMDGGAVLLYNTSVYNREEADQLGLNFGSILEDAIEHPQKYSDKPFFWCSSYSSDAEMLGYLYNNGTYISVEDGCVQCPYENEDYVEYLRNLHSLYQLGAIATKPTGQLYINEGEYVDRVLAGEYSIAFTSLYSVEMIECMQGAYVYQIPFLLDSRLNACTAIASNSAHAQEAMQLIQLLYTDADAGNLICYGADWQEMIAEDGYIEPSLQEAFVISMLTGIFDQLIPRRTDHLATNRLETKKMIYSSNELIDHPYVSFLPVLPNRTMVPMIETVLRDNEKLWASENFDAALANAISEYYASGGAELIEILQQQIDEWNR